MKNNLINKRFGRLVVVKEIGQYKNREIIWHCKCDCGNEVDVRGSSLKSGKTKSCGCIAREKSHIRFFKDLTGKRFDRLTVITKCGMDNNGCFTWLCRCDCGNEIVVSGANLRRGTTKSCGCYKRDMVTSHGMTKTSFYHTWQGMRSRCTNKNSKAYQNYGGRGITVCNRWSSFENFKEDMYESYLNHVNEFGEDNTSIDRIDVNGNYEPSNCRWATWGEQNNNKRNNKYIDGFTLAEYSRNLGLTYRLSTNKANNMGLGVHNELP